MNTLFLALVGRLNVNSIVSIFFVSLEFCFKVTIGSTCFIFSRYFFGCWSYWRSITIDLLLLCHLAFAEMIGKVRLIIDLAFFHLRVVECLTFMLESFLLDDFSELLTFYNYLVFVDGSIYRLVLALFWSDYECSTKELLKIEMLFLLIIYNLDGFSMLWFYFSFDLMILFTFVLLIITFDYFCLI